MLQKAKRPVPSMCRSLLLLWLQSVPGPRDKARCSETVLAFDQNPTPKVLSKEGPSVCDNRLIPFQVYLSCAQRRSGRKHEFLETTTDSWKKSLPQHFKALRSETPSYILNTHHLPYTPAFATESRWTKCGCPRSPLPQRATGDSVDFSRNKSNNLMAKI